MKNTLLLLFLALSLTTSAQSLEFNTGAQLNNFYRLSGYQTTSSYTPKMGYDLNVGIDDVYLNKIRLRFTLGLNTYSGGLRAIQTGDGPYDEYSIDGQVKKTVLRLGFYPFNFKIKKRWNINIGPQFSMLIHEKTDGTYEEWHRVLYSYSNGNPIYIPQKKIGDIDEKYNPYNARYYIGANIRIAYNIPLSERYYLVPQYSFYAGLSNEFAEFPNTTKSISNMLGIGIKRKL